MHGSTIKSYFCINLHVPVQRIEMRRSKKPPWARLETTAFMDTEPHPARSHIPRVSTQFLSDTFERPGTLPHSNLSSLLIVCLVEQLCSFIEKDPVRNHKLNENLLKELRRLQMIDDISTSIEFETMKEKFKHDLGAMVSRAKCCVEDSTINSSLQPIAPRIVDQLDSACSISRYSSEFELLSFISRGGFGQVFSVKNHLDGCKYAIKKIYVRSQNALYHSIINEVTVLARLQHPNIVKYYTAWLEPLSCTTAPSIRIVEESLEHQQCSLLDATQTNSKSIRTKFEESSGSSFIQFCSEEQEWSQKIDGNSNQLKEESLRVYREDKIETSTEQSTSSIEQDSLSPCEAAVIPVHHGGMTPGGAVLYIQMELCGRSLRQWLDWSPVDAEPSSMLGLLQLQIRLSFFWQIASALEYLHQQNIVHHDIKPSNIFVFGNNRVKLGDFGLACSYENSKAQVHHAWGTNTYAAPEQLHGGLCNFKSDVYSTGLVLLELLMPPFKTNAERIHILSQLRNHSQVPETIRTQLPHWGKLLCRLTNSDANLRPTASDLRIKVQDLLCQHFSDINEHSRYTPNDTEQKTTSKISVSETKSFSLKSNKISNKQSNSNIHTMNWSSHVSHNINGTSSRTLETRDDLLVRDSVNGDERMEPLLRLARVQDLEIQVEMLRVELQQKDYQIRALKEQVRLLSLQLQP